MNTLMIAIFLIGGCVIASLIGMFFVRSKVSLSILESHHEVGGYLISVLGTLYAVVLGFVVVDVATNREQARYIVESEANKLADVFRFSNGFNQNDENKIQNACIDYVKTVLKEEWNDMESNRLCENCWFKVFKIWDAIKHTTLHNENENACFSTSLSAFSDFLDMRRTRLIRAHAHVPKILWGILILGGIVTVIFTYFFGLQNIKTQALMTMFVSIVLSSNLFLIVAYNCPYAGDFKINPTAFELNLKLFEQIKEFSK